MRHVLMKSRLALQWTTRHYIPEDGTLQLLVEVSNIESNNGYVQGFRR
jgi:hypothetical protein